MPLSHPHPTDATAHIAVGAAANRSRFDARVMVNRMICREHYLLRLRIGGAFPPTRPGRFVQLGCRPSNGAMDMPALLGAEHTWEPGRRLDLRQPELCGPMALLRRPFSLAGRGDDEHGTWIDIIHRVVGAGTRWLAQLRENDAVDLIGPLGNAFELPAGKSIGLLVGGGVGLPPMFYLAEALQQAGWRAIGFVGALTRDLLAVQFAPGVTPDVNGAPVACVQELARYDFPTVITTDDGSLGLHGRITRGVEQVLAGLGSDEATRIVIYTCGPGPMMHAVAKLAARHGVDCQVCLEQAMACGMGTCQSCVVRIDPTGAAGPPHGYTPAGRPWRYCLACTDGPVFDAARVVW